jgi:signal transduction histidine kinase
MRLKFPERFRKTLAFRLTAWYSSIFIVSCLVVFGVSYFVIFPSLRDNRQLLRSKLREYASSIQQGGVAVVEKEFAARPLARRSNSYFVRVAGSSNETLFLANPGLWEKFDLGLANSRPAEGQWQYIPAKRGGDWLEVISARLPDGSLLQVGKSIQDREEVLEHFRDTVLAITIPMILIGVAGGAFLSFRTLRPIRNLSAVVRSIIDTARFDLRVPASKTDDEMNELVRLFNGMLEKIEVLIRGMKESLDNVAHDLRTPMARLRGVAEEGLRCEAKPEACREALADCLEESEWVMRILNTLMDISEAETGTMHLSVEPVNISALLEDVLDLYRHVAEEKQVSLCASFPNEIYLPADRSRMRQVLANLLDNAIKYTPSGGRIEIEAFQRGQQVTVLFKDTGIGIGPDELPRIWDRLYRGDKSRSQRGLGLGLSLVKAVVHAHNGHVEASQNPAGGSIFTLYLPLAAAT